MPSRRCAWGLSGGGGGDAPVDGGQEGFGADAVGVAFGDFEEGVDEGAGQQVGLQAEFDELGVGDVVVVVGEFDAGVGQVVDADVFGGGGLDGRGDLLDAHPFGDLVEDPELAPVGGVFAGELDAADGVADVDHAAGLAAGAVDGQRVAGDGLDDEPVQHGAEHRIVVEPGGEPFVAGGFGGLLAVDDALVQVGGAQVPDP